MKAELMSLLLLLVTGSLLESVAAHVHYSSHRGLNQIGSRRPREEELPEAEAAVVFAQGRGLGRRFDLKRNGGAAALIAQQDRDNPGKIDRIMQRSNFRGDRAALQRELEHDPDMGLDLDAEAIMFQCVGLAVGPSSPPAPAAVAAATTTAAAAAAPEITSGLMPGDPDPLTEQAFNLSSRPGATKKIYLNFRGGIVTGTAWNTAAGSSTINIPAYDTDGNTAAFSTAELANIVAIWRGVAEDYAPFNVDVTTIRPASLVGSSHVMIGGDGSWYGSAGGVGYVGIMNNPSTYYQPAFVFPGMLGNGYPKYVWEAVSHEAGHNMGLSHDGVINADGSVTGYYSGQNGWAPIMGVGYYQPLTQWSKGEYSAANNLEDDFSIIGNAVGWVPNNNGISIATANPLDTVVADSINTGKAAGIVTKAGVSDFFSFDAAAAGTATITVTVVMADAYGKTRSNLDALLTVYNSASAVIATANPIGTGDASGLGLSTTVTLPAAGRYFISVGGAGTGDPTTGWSNYGSAGQYAITATYPAVVVVPSPSPAAPSPSPAVPSPSPAIPSPSPAVPSPSPDVPSPSPAVPSPSPAVPSPSPAVPSPSPAVPSPSPAPASTTYMVASVTVTSRKSGNGNNARYTCTAVVSVKTTANVAVPSPTINFEWSTSQAWPGYPYTGTIVASTSGSATVSTTNTLNTGARGCTLRITSVTKAATLTTTYVVSPNVLMPATASTTWSR